ncbi:hypothetical protein HDU98_007604 [Podochytrium sp. JEL0797]|nr:hypothetical protein HDU98_007604 [Podochytrium sp. JEL0797]
MSRRAWERNSANLAAGPNAAGGSVQGPTSALSSFLRERGIHAGRINPYARLPGAEPLAANANAEGDNVEARAAGEGEGEGETADAAEGDDDEAVEDEEAAEVERPVEAEAAEASAASAQTGSAPGSSAKAKAKPAKRAKKKAKTDTALPRFFSNNTPQPDDSLRFCRRCLRKFVPDSDASDTCPACLTIPASGKKKGNIAALKRKREGRQDDIADGAIHSLRDLCIKLIADNIESVDAFGDIPDYVKRSIARILSRKRAINNSTMQLFIGPEEVIVELFDCARLTPESFNQIVLLSPNIHTLHLADCGQITDPVIHTLATSCPHISSLTLKGAFLVKDAAFATLFSSPLHLTLRDLHLENTAKLGPNSIQAITTHCTSLHHLTLSQCPAITGTSLRTLSTLTSITSLQLTDLDPEIQDADVIHVLTSLGPTLTTLAVNHFPSLTDTFLSDGLALLTPNLLHLSLRSNPSLTDTGFLAYLNTPHIHLSPLKSLDLFRLYNLTDDTIASIISHHGASLTKLGLNGLDDLSTKAVHTVVTGCPEMQDLDLSWIRSVDDELFGECVRRCRGLKKIGVYGCNLLTEFSLVKRFWNGEGEVVRVVGNEFD